jgi:hypothetical protein
MSAPPPVPPQEDEQPTPSKLPRGKAEHAIYGHGGGKQAAAEAPAPTTSSAPPPEERIVGDQP